MRLNEIKEIKIVCSCGVSVLIRCGSRHRIPKFCPSCEEEFPKNVREMARILRDIGDEIGNKIEINQEVKDGINTR